jgi:hypothetical protein
MRLSKGCVVSGIISVICNFTGMFMKELVPFSLWKGVSLMWNMMWNLNASEWWTVKVEIREGFVFFTFFEVLAAIFLIACCYFAFNKSTEQVADSKPGVVPLVGTKNS